jgi:hypothetical protein
MVKRAKQANFVALNIRLPPGLHTMLREAAGATRSLNTEILDRLQQSFDTHKPSVGWRAKVIASSERRTQENLKQLAKRIDELEKSLRGKKP